MTISILSIIAFVLVGYCVWWILSRAPVPEPFKWALQAIALLFLCGYFLQFIGVWHGSLVRFR